MSMTVMKSARNSPNDLLSVRVPSGVPSPDLQPNTMLTPGDLMKFDAGGAVGVNGRNLALKI
jgi:hypothetical protein